MNNYVYQEANLAETPFFTTPQGRDVFVPAEIITEAGLADWTNSRISDALGRTLVLTPDGWLNQQALVFEGSARIGRDGYLSASFTLNRARDNSSYSCCMVSRT